MYFIVTCLHVLTNHVTVCVCHAELKGYLLTYLLTRDLIIETETSMSSG